MELGGTDQSYMQVKGGGGAGKEVSLLPTPDTSFQLYSFPEVIADLARGLSI